MDKDLLKKYYCDDLLTIEKIAELFNTTYNKVLRTIKQLNLVRDKKVVQGKATKRVADKKFNNLLEKIPYAELKELYLDQNYSYSEILSRYNITGYTFDKILRHYSLKKSRKQSAELVLKTKIDKYGLSNNNNWVKGRETRIKNSGSLAKSYANGREKQKKTLLEKYGYESSLLLAKSYNREHSKANEDFARKLDLLGIEYSREFKLLDKIYDFKVNNTLIEINPTITHNADFNPYNKNNNYVGIDKNYHAKKSKLARDNRYRCIQVWDWDNLDKIINMLKKPLYKVYARSCIIREVGLKEARDFLNLYHTQNYCKAKYKIGLYLDNRLISIMTFGKPRYNKKYNYELLRYCTDPRYQIVGGAARLFNYFVKLSGAKSIISYCDYSKFNGDVYLKLGFKFIILNNSCMHWYNIKTKEHYTHNLINKQGFSRIINHLDAKDDIDYGTDDNNILMREAGFLSLYDSGQATYL